MADLDIEATCPVCGEIWDVDLQVWLDMHPTLAEQLVEALNQRGYVLRLLPRRETN